MATFTGTSGNDTILGGTGNDIINGLAGNDQLFGYEGDDSITGGAGDDHLWGGLGNDTLDGGDGTDAVYYSDASAAVEVNLAAGTASGTGSGTDTLISIEIVFGSSFGDLLIGSASNDILYGQDGNDTIDGGPGDDQIFGGNGNDLLVGGAGSDYFQFRTTSADTSTDTLTDFQAGLGGDWLSIPTWLFSNYQKYANPFSSGHARLTQSGANTLVEIDVDGVSGPAGFETIAILTHVSASSLVASNLGGFVPMISMLGTAGPDVLTGTAGNDNISGMSGNDTLSGGAGSDLIDGGVGIDTAVYGTSRSNFTLARTGAAFILTDNTGATGTDTLINIERLGFSDKKIALDLSPTEHAGQALEFIGLLAPTLVSTPSVVGLILGLFDQGQSMHDVCQLALDAGLVSSIAGSNTNQALAAMAFRNLIGTEADAATVGLLVSYMDGRSASYSQADFMTILAGFEINQTHINLVGLQQTGIEYS